jgi:hypothetical protein
VKASFQSHPTSDLPTLQGEDKRNVFAPLETKHTRFLWLVPFGNFRSLAVSAVLVNRRAPVAK